ncbi:hypothetical protein E6Q11_04070 [Candidatus Dojkabacteria bacterium]|uniref:Uncharacterized protein n=1 Tax=Candidatus Dojkabacteria bacterium TaxID=2099670 RepID=A0A5C7J767_9BACT|nr:MAG: hypothetical protein E6Q11_04070 [Candidatus Dojkabacteria bacterium]
MLLDRTAFVSALSPESGDKESFTTFSGFMFAGTQSAAIRVNIQPASPELTAISEGEVFKTYKAFTTASGVIEGMLLTVSGTNELFRVRGREAFGYGAGQHYELTLVKSNPNGA